MAIYVTDDGICLRVMDFSETSQIVGIFTRRHGLVPLIAKGAKRQSKKNTLSGPLDLLTSGEVVFVPAKESSVAGGTGGGLGTLAAWELADHRRSLRQNLTALNAAMLCAEITTLLMQPHDPHPDLFAELEASLDLLGNGAHQRSRTAVAYVKAALLSAGYWPQVGVCTVCGRAVTNGPMRFSPRAGVVLCGQGAAGCHIENSGVFIAVAGQILRALDRLPSPVSLRGDGGVNPPQRAADEAALATAMQLLLAQVEALTDKAVRTRSLLPGIFKIERTNALPANEKHSPIGHA